MADLAEVFNILIDATSKAGEPAISRTEGEAAAGQAGLIGFSFKDSSGNVVLPQLTATGKIPVDTEATAGVCHYAHGELAAGSATMADVTNAEVTIPVNKVFEQIGAVVSCLRTSLFQIVYVDDAGGTPVETVLEELLVGPGQFTINLQTHCLELDTTGGTGVQKLKIKGQNLVGSALSSLRATIFAFELAAS